MSELMNKCVGEWTDGWLDDWMHGWLNVCVGCLLVVDLLGLWRVVRQGPLAWLDLP